MGKEQFNLSSKWKWLAKIIIVIGLALIPSLIDLGSITDIMILLFLYLILGQSFNILAGYTGLISLGHSAFLGVGALATRYVLISGTPVYVAITAGGLAAILIAIIIGVPTLRLRGAYFAMGTLALTMISFTLISNIFVQASFMSLSYVANYSVLPRYYLALILAIISVVSVYFLSNSRVGMGMIAIRENQDAAASLGINIFRCKLIALVISALFAGLAGGLFAYYQISYFHYEIFGPLWSFAPILVATIGGLGSVVGPIIGAVFYVVLREVFALTAGDTHVIIFGAIFIIVVLLLPGGLLSGIHGCHKFINMISNKSYRAKSTQCEK